MCGRQYCQPMASLTAGYLALTDTDLRREIQKMSFRTARVA